MSALWLLKKVGASDIKLAPVCTKGITMRSHEKGISKTKSQPNEVDVIWLGGAAA